MPQISIFPFPLFYLPGQQLVLPLRIKNSQIIPSPFTVSKVRYGNDRNDQYSLNTGDDGFENTEIINRLKTNCNDEKIVKSKNNNSNEEDENTERISVDNIYEGKSKCKYFRTKTRAQIHTRIRAM
jgi:hypothetical protein